MVERLLERYGKPKFEPGDRSAYSNIGYLVLGELVAEVSGTPYERYVVERVLEPLGARRTGFSFPAEERHAWSEGAHPRRDPLLPLLRLLVPRWAFGPTSGKWRLFRPFYLDGAAYGGLVGPVGDAALLAAAHLGRGALGERRILSAQSATEISASTRRVSPTTSGSAGFARIATPSGSRDQHLGGGGGTGRSCACGPIGAVGVVAMANVSFQRLDYETLLKPLATD